MASRLAPRASRADFRAEWDAEIAWAASAARRATVRRPRRELLRRSLGAVFHALWLRKEQWRLEMLWQDLRYGVRLLMARPSFTIVASLTLALGIGANTAIFSLVYGVLLKPLPFHEPHRLVALWETNPLRNWTHATAAPANLFDWKERTRTLADIAFYPSLDDKSPMYASTTIAGDGADPERLRGLQVSANFFRVLGVRPVAGRDFLDSEQEPGHNRVAVISYPFWQSRFRGDPSIVGRDIQINTRAYRVVGIAPPSFRFPTTDVQLWIPYGIDLSSIKTVQGRRGHFLRPIARLKPGVTLAQAREDMRRMMSELEREYPETNSQMGADAGPLQDWVIADVRRALLVFLGAVGMVLLVACANLANLLLARASGRRREFAIRTALGGGGWRLARQVLTESALLAVLGGALGAVVAQWALQALIVLTPAGVPRLDEVALDGRMLLFVGALTSVIALLFGLLPAWHSARTDAGCLRDQTRTVPGGGGTRRSLVIAQVAAAVALVICAGLLLRSFVRLQSVSPGFDPEHVVSFTTTIPGAKYDDDAKITGFYEQLLDRVRAMPGVRAAGASTVIGLRGQGWTGDLFIEKQPEVWGRELRHKEVTAGYFSAMGLSLRGRDFAPTDGPDAPRVVVVNEALARTYFTGQDPIGQRLAFRRPKPGDATIRWWTIVGVVHDEKQQSLAEPVAPEVYGTHLQQSSTLMTVVVRTSDDAAAIVPSLRAELRAVDPVVAMFDVRTLNEVVSLSMARERFTAWIVGLFAALALVIAGVGVYGVVSYSISRRTSEIGIRVALGAGRRQIVGLVLQETLLLAGVGLVAGTLAASAAGRAIRTFLFETTPTDPATYAIATAILGSVALIASYVPLRRALAVDPSSAMRTE